CHKRPTGASGNTRRRHTSFACLRGPAVQARRERESTATRRGAAPPGLRSQRRRSERRGKAVPVKGEGEAGGGPEASPKARHWLRRCGRRGEALRLPQREMARRLVALLAERAQRGLLLGADLLRPRAAGPEPAPGRRVDGRRELAGHPLVLPGL